MTETSERRRGANQVLIVDDDPDLRDAMEMLLSLQGYEVAVAADGGEALQSLTDQRCQPFLVLLDLMMPGMDGYELVKRMTADPDLADIPVVLLTGAGIQADRRAHELRKEVLRKPITRQMLLAVVERFRREAS